MVQAAVGPPKTTRMTVPAGNMKIVTPVQITGGSGPGARTIQLPNSGSKSGVNSSSSSSNIPVARVTPQQHTSVSVTTGIGQYLFENKWRGYK